ncbi:MAG: sugar phosphate isomerase/epimerase [Candidatus Aenigmarchaeota archaeon]|nr:sugar phosphate isomerase/epimerase [Candidatus Aenigmarchaeota archaeon]
MKEQLPKFGMMTNPSEDIISEINKASKLGMDYVEICIEPPEALPETIMKNKNRILSALKQFSYPPIMHSVYWVDLGNAYENIRKAWVEEIKNEIIVTSQLRAEKFNIHFNARGILKTKTYQKIILDNYIISLKELTQFAKKYKIKLVFENTPHPHSRFENYRQILNRVPGLYVHLDIGHIFITDGIQGIKKFFSFSKRIEHIHIHDNYGKEDDHLPLGKGKINFPAVIKELKKIRYNKTITFEIHTNKRDFVKSVKIFKRLWLK